MYARIVVPLDGSWLAEQALVNAEELARDAAVPIRLIRVVDPNRLDHFGLDKLVDIAGLAEKVEDAQRAAAAYLAGVARPLEGRGLSVETQVLRGDPAREIVGAGQPGDLLVISTHGRDGARRWVIGSVAEAVARHASVPVMLVRITAPSAHSNGSEHMADLLSRDQYRPEELADLLNMDVTVVRQAALTGRLHAQIADHHVLSVTRADALRWLADRS
jgi:nucleotide-binding universal stress UspA family protein